MKMLLVCLFINFGFNQIVYAAKPLVRLCYEDQTVYPWITGDQKGLAITQLKIVEKSLNLNFKLIRLPWKRCQLKARAGHVDGLIAASFSKNRTQWGTYPTNSSNQLDREYRTHTDSFYVYVRKNSKINWDGEKFQNLGELPVGVQLGYSVGNDLQDQSIKTHSSFTTPYELLKALDSGNLEVAVLQKFATLKTLKDYPDLGKNIVKIDTPFKVVDQYVLLNTKFYNKNTELSNKIWKALALSRKNPEYIKSEQSLPLKVTEIN